MTPVISIIVPAFNEEKYISRCLDSILNQTFTDFEVLCIDDGSTDSTFDIISEYSEKDSRIIPLKNPEKGVSSARNFGIKNSKGKYIGFVDSDDFIQPQMYEFLYKAISENNGDMSVCNCDKSSEIIIKNFSYKSEKCICNQFFNTNVEPLVSVCTRLVKADIIKNRISFKNYKIGEDCLFCSELWVNSKNVFYVDLPLYFYVNNYESSTHIDISDKKWLDLSETYFISYNILKNYSNQSAKVWFIENGMKFLLSYRLFSKNNKDKNNKKRIKNLYKEYFSEYKNCSEISAANKIYVFVSYHFPLLYEVRRKLLDKTIR